jgi:hypothetical protein
VWGIAQKKVNQKSPEIPQDVEQIVSQSKEYG